MKEKPILMSTEMVKAILDGRKTQTRRVVKGIALEWLQPGMFTPEFVADKDNELCPYGQVGSRLWVRETWAVDYLTSTQFEEMLYLDYKADGREVRRVLPEVHKYMCSHYGGDGWHPSIHMPRWASRIDRIIALLRAERLLDISEADAKAEGFNSIEEFLTYWDIMNKKRGYGTDTNPWNWVIGWEYKALVSFKRGVT